MSFKVFDIGYGYLKYPNEKGEIEKVQAVIAQLGKTMNDPECDIFTVDGIRYVVGEDVYKLGLKPMTANESNERPKNIVYKVLGLYALVKMKTVEPCIAITGLPHQQLDDEADLVKSVFRGEHEVNLNSEDIEIKVDDVKVVSQGYGTFQYLKKEKGGGIEQGKRLLVDMGFGTIIYMPITNGGIDTKMVKTSRKMGIQRAYSRIVDNVNQEFKKNFKFYRIDEFLDHGVPIQGEEGIVRIPISDREYVAEVFDEYTVEVWQDIYDKYDEEFLDEIDEIIFTGGSSQRVNKYLHENSKQYDTYIENAQDAQIKGYGIIAEKLAASQVQA